ncbi:MAG: hypothetical protein JW776_12605 [Candidatus Lokiarchaeota archaeon]|nr:hypothetical protein [Candidatus Lokiarchaeota archaeon]
MEQLRQKSKKNSIFLAGIVATIATLGILIPGIVLWVNHPMISTSYYHYNLQYRAGQEQTYPEIVENSLQHIIYMYGNHSTWNYTIECQFMLIEYVHDNYPTLFDEIQAQNSRGQLELIVVQFSSAFHVPYPVKNFRESVNYTSIRMEEYGLRQSILILLQEGQWLPAFGQAVPNHVAAILSIEQCGYFNYYPKQPVLEWNFGGVKKHAFMIPWFPRFEAGVYHHQIYTQDGEKINTGGYGSFDVAVDFDFNPLKQANLEKRHIELEENGNLFMTLEDFYNYCVENEYVESMEKYIPETEWVAAQYQTFWTWMGQGSGWTDDGHLLARIYNAMTITQATELLLNKSYTHAVINDTNFAEWGQYRIGGQDGKLLQAKKLVWEAQVTDTTGISPRYFEFWYGMNKTSDALHICSEIIENIRFKPTFNTVFGNNLQINPYTLSIENQTSSFLNVTDLGVLSICEIEGLFDLAILSTQSDEYALYPAALEVSRMNLKANDWSQEYFQLNFKFRGKYNVEYNNTGDNYISEEELNSMNTMGVISKNDISIHFFGNWSTVSYSPALLENESINLVRDHYYSFPYESKAEWWILLSACNGMVYNPQGGFGIVKNNTVRHLAANWRSTHIEFAETEIKYNSTHQYFIVPGTVQEVLRFANQINSYRWITL